MAAKILSLLEISNERVHCVDGDDSEEIRNQFAREAEGLQLICKELGRSLGTPRLNGCAVSSDDGGLSFRFMKASSREIDARGIFVSGESYSASSLMQASLAGEPSES
ncbi:hypothetical protein VSU19_06030 [Verrucomicrobiales bacterium BCK34]|nr:hypothetical protein [Verrucomicrobiales bacterium BCK34]